MDNTTNKEYHSSDSDLPEFQRRYIRREVLKAYQAMQNGEEGEDFETAFAELRRRYQMT